MYQDIKIFLGDLGLHVKDDPKLLHLSWEDVQRLGEELGGRVRENGFVPDMLAAVSRGGFAPARILCDQLSVRKLASLQIEYYAGVGQRLKTPKVVIPLNVKVEGLRLLVVDDVSDSGGSLRVAKEHVLDRGASEARIATLHVKPWTRVKPDFFVEEVDAWIVYPWEPREVLMDMRERLKGRGLTRDEVSLRLIEMGFRPELVAKLI